MITIGKAGAVIISRAVDSFERDRMPRGSSACGSDDNLVPAQMKESMDYEPRRDIEDLRREMRRMMRAR